MLSTRTARGARQHRPRVNQPHLAGGAENSGVDEIRWTGRAVGIGTTSKRALQEPHAALVAT